MIGVALCGVATLVLLGMLGMVLHNQRRAPRLDEAPAPLATPRVSVLLPARNEAHNLAETLPLLLQNDYPDWEVLALDDRSTDDTAAVIEKWAARSHGRLRRLEGKPLPDGWNGKNWACAQLAEAATGDVLIFCDADVHTGGRVMAQTVSLMQHWGAGALTVIPHQQLHTWAEQAIVPLLMHVPTLGTVPLRQAAASRRASLTVANGQWLAFSRACYDAIGGHEAAKDAIVEDMVLCKKAKRAGRRVVTALALSQLSVRMYDSLSAVREGFSKNLFGLMEYRVGSFVAVAAVFSLTMILPWTAPLWAGPVGWLPLAALVAFRGRLAQVARHPTSSVLWHPVGALLLLGIALESLWRTRTDRLSWKGRRLVRPGQPLPANAASLVDNPSLPAKASSLVDNHSSLQAGGGAWTPESGASLREPPG